MPKRLVQGPANPVWIVDAFGVPVDWVEVIYTPITFAALQTAVMGNAGPAQVVAANGNRRTLFLTNISDTTGFFSIGSAVGLTTTNYLFRLVPNQTVSFVPPVTQQAIFAVCGAAAKNVGYQEAT